MRKRVLNAALVAALFCAPACGGGASPGDSAGSPGLEQPPPVSTDPGPSSVATEAGRGVASPGRADPSAGAAEAPDTAPDAKPGNATTWTPGPALGGATAAPPQQPGDSPDQFDRRAHYPPGAVAVVSGGNAQAEWRLYAYREDGETCVHFESHSSTGGGAGAKCQKPPLDPSTSDSERGRFGYGLTSADVAKIRFEHADGSSETFDAVAAAGHPEYRDRRFYAGELARTPLKRVVALDGSGKVVAEKTDMTAYNL